jgi:integrase
MAGKQAKILSDDQVERLLSFASTTRNLLRNRVLVLLSLKAGRRAGEIANLTWPMVLDPSGDNGPVIDFRDPAAQKNANGLARICSIAGAAGAANQ